MRAYMWPAIVLAAALFAHTLAAQTTEPVITSGGIVNAASLAADTTNVAAPGSLVSIFGSNLATTTALAPSIPWPTELNGTAVLVGNTFAPLAFISPTQINAQIPFEVPSGSTVSVVVWVNGRSSSPVSLRVESAAPGIFTVSQNGVGLASVLHADSTAVSGSSPAAPGEEVTILSTGLGATLSTGSLSAVKTGEAGNGQPTLLAPTVTIGGAQAQVTSSTAAPGSVGQYLIRAIVPNVTAGDQPLAVTIGERVTRAAVFVPVGTPFTQPGGGGQGIVPVIFSDGIINAASLVPAPDNKAAPGALISIFGTNLATTTADATAAPLPRDLGGTSVIIANIAAPLLLVSPTQINAQVPFEIQPGTAVNVVVVVNGRSSAPEPLELAAGAPGIFTVSGSGSGPARILHANGTPVSSTSPALPGEELTIFSTGLGATLSTGSLSAVKTGEAGNGQLTVLTPTVTIGGKDARVISSVAASGLVGQYLVKVVVPDVAAGDHDVRITAAGNASRASVLLRIGFLFAQPPAFFQLHLEGSFASTFGLKVKVPDPVDSTKEIDEIASFLKSIPAPRCTIDIAGTDGPTYSALVHCQDYSDPNHLMAIIMGLKDGRFADNKLVFTTILDSTVNHFFYLGPGQTPSRSIVLYVDSPITDGAVSIDLRRPDFAAGDTNIVGTLRATFSVGGSATIPSQTVVMGGSFVDTITFVRR